MSELDDKVAPLPKVAAETLVLRGRPRPVTRFRKSVVIGGIAAISATLIALTWTALRPATFRNLAAGDSGRPFERAAPDALAGAPRDYRDVPALGPPLPGDLGRPILEQQRGLAAAQGGPSMLEADPAAERAAALRQQRLATEAAARSSSLVVQLATDGTVRSAAPQPLEQGAAEPEQVAHPFPASKVGLGEWGRSDTNAHSLTPPASRWMVAAGTIIPASLVTGLNSDLPGMAIAEVSENVRDSATGRTVLIPQGARLIGQYDSSIGYGQKRALVAWQRIIFPDGSSLRLDNMPAGDAGGYEGLSDRVDRHGWQLIKGVVLSTILGVGTQLSLGGESGIVRALRESMQQNGSQAGEQIVSKGLSVQPTIKVRPGWPVRVLISEDLVLQPWRG